MKRRVAYIVYATKDNAHLLDGTYDLPAHTGTFVSIDSNIRLWKIITLRLCQKKDVRHYCRPKWRAEQKEVLSSGKHFIN